MAQSLMFGSKCNCPALCPILPRRKTDVLFNFPLNTLTCWKDLDDFKWVFKTGHTKLAG